MDFSQARQCMVDGQLRPNRVTDKKLLNRFGMLPREQFVQNSCRSYAYCDNPIQIAPERELLAPQVTAHLIQELQLEETDNMLVVASGTGYSALLIAPLVKQVIGIEDQAGLVDQARRSLIDSQFTNVQFSCKDVTEGARDFAPFDKILVDAAINELPNALVDQLKNGGRLSAIVKGTDGLLEAAVFQKNGKKMDRTCICETHATVHPAFQKAEPFVF